MTITFIWESCTEASVSEEQIKEIIENKRLSNAEKGNEWTKLAYKYNAIPYGDSLDIAGVYISEDETGFPGILWEE